MSGQGIMSTKIRILCTSVFLASAAFFTPAMAQSAAELNVRMMQLEDQVRQLVGQVEQLTYQVQQLRDAAPAQLPKKKASNDTQMVPLDGGNTVQSAELPQPAKKNTQNQGVEQIEDPSTDMMATVVDENGNEQQVAVQKAPGPKILGTLPGSADDSSTGTGFQGQVLVARGGQQVSDGTRTVSLDENATTDLDSPEKTYEQAYENLLRRQFSDAETGFQSFLSKYHNHSLAGNAQYWLGETYYVQGDYKTAAQTFLSGYQDFPKSRKAADSLLKLGLSLGRLGQKDQACAAYGEVSEKFPNATEARKRAQNEWTRAGC